MEVKKVFLYPGNLFAHSEPHIVTTILGSCVAVCLWDPILRIGGINHYLLPLWNGDELPTPKYGNIAIQELVKRMMELGSKTYNLKAKVFGGASMNNASGFLNVGERNSMLAEEMLNDLKIEIVSKDLRGNKGRKLFYFTDSGLVKLKKIESSAEKDE